MENAFKNSYIVDDKDLVSLSVYNVGFQKCKSLHQWGPGIRDHYLIHYVVSGKGYYYIGAHKFTVGPGDAFLIYPNTEIVYYADQENPWEYYWVGFLGSDAAQLTEAAGFTKSVPFLHTGELGPKIQQHLFQIYQARGNTYVNAVKMTGELYLALSLFILISGKTARRKSSSFSYVQNAIDYIVSHYSYPISVEDIANYVGISRSHLYREFKSNLDISPKQYLSDYRIQRACHLLKTSQLSITAIANSVGFENNLYFSKVFHSAKGVSPTEYISKLKREEL
ncbi:MAG: helix-turn-helix domain-containing protein [Lachnospiraceae bacterium]